MSSETRSIVEEEVKALVQVRGAGGGPQHELGDAQHRGGGGQGAGAGAHGPHAIPPVHLSLLQGLRCREGACPIPRPEQPVGGRAWTDAARRPRHSPRHPLWWPLHAAFVLGSPAHAGGTTPGRLRQASTRNGRASFRRHKMCVRRTCICLDTSAGRSPAAGRSRCLAAQEAREQDACTTKHTIRCACGRACVCGGAGRVRTGAQGAAGSPARASRAGGGAAGAGDADGRPDQGAAAGRARQGRQAGAAGALSGDARRAAHHLGGFWGDGDGGCGWATRAVWCSGWRGPGRGG